MQKSQRAQELTTVVPLELGVRGLTKIKWFERQPDPLGPLPHSTVLGINPLLQQDRGSGCLFSEGDKAVCFISTIGKLIHVPHHLFLEFSSPAQPPQHWQQNFALQTAD